MPAPVVIGVDWGGTHLRALLIAADGAVLERREAACGAISLAAGGHAPRLAQALGDWRALALPVLVCGMAGARNGWREVAYRPCPADAASLYAGRVEVEAGVWLLPGVMREGAAGAVEVMRGEETQVLGALELDAALADACIVCPGTHSKWIRLREGRIAEFRTCITGELFAALAARWPPLDPAADPAEAWAVFDRAVEVGLREPLASALFTVRSGYATRRLHDTQARDYLSGLLIGAEIAACRDRTERSAPRLIGAPALSARYARAFVTAGMGEAIALEADACVAAGLSSLWRARGAHR